MSLTDFLEKLQKKPRWIKVQIMWAAVIACMIVVVAVWIWSLGSLSKSEPAAANAGTSEFLDTLGQMKKDIPTLWQSLGAGIGNILKSAQEETELTPAPEKSPETTIPMDERLPIE